MNKEEIQLILEVQQNQPHNSHVRQNQSNVRQQLLTEKHIHLLKNIILMTACYQSVKDLIKSKKVKKKNEKSAQPHSQGFFSLDVSSREKKPWERG